DGRRAAMWGEFYGHVSREHRFHMGAEGGTNLLRVLAGDEAEGNLGAGAGRDHGLEAVPDIAAAHAVDLAGRAGPELFEHGAALFAGWHREVDRAQKGLFVKAEPGP